VTQNLDVLVDGAWKRWETRIEQFIEGSINLDARVFYDDLVLAAADRMPSRVMHAHPRQIGPLDWSELALAGSQASSLIGRGWALFPGLRRQGFGRELLTAISSNVGDLENSPWIFRLITTAPAAEKGVLVILHDDSEQLERVEPGPYLFLREARIEEYDAAVIWLNGFSAFRVIVDER